MIDKDCFALFTCPNDLTERLKNYFLESDQKVFGQIGKNGQSNHHLKKCAEIFCSFTANDVFQEYFDFIKDCTNQYVEALRWPFSARYFEPFKIQGYQPNEAYFVPHFEKGDESLLLRRTFVFMTYLNTLTSPNGEGGTRWTRQDRIEKPVAGKTIFWPAEFTHEHHGIVHTTENKFIATGWVHV